MSYNPFDAFTDVQLVREVVHRFGGDDQIAAARFGQMVTGRELVTIPVTEALERFAATIGDSAADVAEHFTCTEVEAMANLFDALGRADDAEAWRYHHAQADNEGDQHFDLREDDDDEDDEG